MIESELIAERIIYAIDKESRGFEIRIMIGRPYQTESKYGDWACPVAAIGLHGFYHDMHGVDSWQALTLALKLIHGVLTGFVEDGGRLFWEKDGEEQPVGSLLDDRHRELQAPLTEQQYRERIDALTPDQLQRIDDTLMAGASTEYRKVARVVGIAMSANEDSIQRIPDYFYASRVQKLVAEGRLISQGNRESIRHSEIKLPE